MRVLVIGNGMAGSRVAAEVHARCDEAKVIVLGAEAHPAYNRILLSSVLAGKVDERAVRTAGAHGPDVRLGVPATRIDRAARSVHCGTDEAVEYDWLVLATGSRALIPPLPGLTEPLPDNVAAFRTLDDARRILSAAAGASSAVVLGGGLLGLEAARGLAARGLQVQIVHAVGHLMERQLDPAAGAVLVRTLGQLGITARLDAAATAVESDEEGVTLQLADGATVSADLLVVACGVRPETDLARDAGLPVGRGVVVDDELRTADPHILAVGDCAEHAGVVSGLVAPAWEQARVAAQVIAGQSGVRYRPPPTITRLKAAGIDLAAMGDPTLPDDPTEAEDLSFADPSRGTYARLLIVGDRLRSAIMLGDNPAVGTVVQLFDRGGLVPADRRSLLLGRSFGTRPAVAESPALMPDAAPVCQCNTVSKGDIVRCWRAGAASVGDVVAGTRATTGCGTCRDAVEGIVAWLSTVDPQEGAAA